MAWNDTKEDYNGTNPDESLISASDWNAMTDAVDLNTAKVSFDSTSSTRLANTSGTNTGDQDLSSYALSSAIPTTLSALSDDSTHRLVTDTEKSTWNAKQDALTVGVDYLVPSAIAASYAPILTADENYVTDAQLTVISNTSGTNTGDQDLSSYATTDGAKNFTGQITVIDTGGADGNCLVLDQQGGATSNFFSFQNNTAEVAYMDGNQIGMPRGSVGTVSYGFMQGATYDVDTGMWSPANNTVAFSAGGTELLRLSSTGVRIGGNLSWNAKGLILEGVSPSGLSVGNLARFNGTNWVQADASAEATATGMLGVYITTNTILTHGVYTTTGLTAGATYYMSETAGAITTTATTTSTAIVRIIGYALSTTQLFVDPDKSYIEVA